MAETVGAWEHGGKKSLILWKQAGQPNVARSVGNLMLSLLAIRRDEDYKLKVIKAFKHVESKVKFPLELHDALKSACLFEEFDEKGVQYVRQQILEILAPQDIGLREFIESSYITAKSFDPEQFYDEIDRYIMSALSAHAWECEFTVKLSNDDDDVKIRQLIKEYFTGIGCSFAETMPGAFQAKSEKGTWLIITSVYPGRMMISAEQFGF